MRFLKWYSAMLVSLVFVFYSWMSSLHFDFSLSELSDFIPSLIFLPAVIYLWATVKKEGNIKRELPIAASAFFAVLLVIYMFKIYLSYSVQ